jgi:hypothetical protein
MKNMKNPLFNMKVVLTGSYKAIVGAGSLQNFLKVLEEIVSAPQH